MVGSLHTLVGLLEPVHASPIRLSKAPHVLECIRYRSQHLMTCVFRDMTLCFSNPAQESYHFR